MTPVVRVPFLPPPFFAALGRTFSDAGLSELLGVP